MSVDGYMVGVDARDCEGAFFVVTDVDGAMFLCDYGGFRFVFFVLYGWKSVKYLF